MASDSALVSSIIPARNAERFISQAIESVLGQTYPHIECIVVDDGSTDDTLAVASSFGDRVACVSRPHRGVSEARNYGISRARGEYVAFLDADDAWLPRKIELQMRRFLGRRDLGMVYSGLHIVDHDLVFVGREDPPADDTALRNTLLLERPIMSGLGSSGVIPKPILEEVGGFDEQLSTSADCDLGCRIALSYAVSAVPRPLVLYRMHDHQIHLDPSRTEHDMKIVYKKVFGDPRLSPELRRLRGRAVANLYVSLAGAHLMKGQHGRFIRYALKALGRRPDRVYAALRRLARPGGGLSRAA